jgi:methylase of polypeptide subunit release factors
VQTRLFPEATPFDQATARDAAADRRSAALGVLAFAVRQHYRFTTPTPLTHARVLANRSAQAADNLRDVFGWNMPFAAEKVAPELVALMQQADMLAIQRNGLLRSTSRIASVEGDLFLHSSYPTTQDDAVFFGPDTYRFIRFMHQSLAPLIGSARWHAEKPVRVLDIGCGSGAGGLAVARALTAAGLETELVMNDINPLALRHAAINAAHTGVAVTLANGDFEVAARGHFDIIVSNPPYMADPARRAYRHGGDGLGRELSLRIAHHALQHLTPGGALLLYTGVAMVQGSDPFLEAMKPVLGAARCSWSYEEIDPDVFGEELAQPAYTQVERIAAVGLVAKTLPEPPDAR